MIKFFRKIRQRLLTENKFSKYLIYALGEILLVVIGILFALQVNNWNEHRKLRNTEIKLLTELKADLNTTMEDLVTDIAKAQRNLTLTDSLYQKLMVNKKSDNLEPLTISGSIYLKPNLFAKLSAYESLLNFGINNISNDSLRRNITDFYQLHLTRVKESEKLLWDLDNEELRPYLSQFSDPASKCKDCFSLFDELSKGTFWNSEKIQPTNKLIHLLKYRFGRHYQINKLYAGTDLRIKNLINLIDREIDKK